MDHVPFDWAFRNLQKPHHNPRNDTEPNTTASKDQLHEYSVTNAANQTIHIAPQIKNMRSCLFKPHLPTDLGGTDLRDAVIKRLLARGVTHTPTPSYVYYVGH